MFDDESASPVEATNELAIGKGSVANESASAAPEESKEDAEGADNMDVSGDSASAEAQQDTKMDIDEAVKGEYCIN
jgi:hypothetical protein